MGRGEGMSDIEPLWDAEQFNIHPALDFISTTNQAVVSQWIPALITYTFKDKETGKEKQKKRKEMVLALIFSDNSISYVKEGLKCGNYYLEVFPNKIRNRWSMESIKKFNNGSREMEPTLEEIFNKIKDELKYYIELPGEDEYDFLSLWAIGTYFFPLFNSYPYVFLNGVKRSGKSKLLRFMECICFNAKNALSMTSATLFRLIQNSRCSLFIDEVEKLPKKDIGDFRSMLLAGYKKGARVPRASEMKNKKVFQVEEFDVYSPKMLANIAGIEDVLEDRCITIIMLRAKNKAIANREIDFEDEKWQNIRDELYVYLLKHWTDVKRNYDMLKEFISFEPGSSVVNEINVMKTKDENEISVTNKTSDTNKILSLYTDFYTETTQTTLDKLYTIHSRDAELWIPILGLALTVQDNVFWRMVDFCLRKVKEKYEENLTETTDIILIENLLKMVKKDGFYSIREITKNLKTEFEEGEADWINTRWVGWAMRRLSFLEKRRIGSGVEIRLTPEMVKNVAERLGIEVKEKQLEEENQ